MRRGGTANLLTPSYTRQTQADYTYGVDNYATQYEHFLGSGSLGYLQYVVAAGTTAPTDLTAGRKAAS
jgi:hypothetical protein